MLLACYCNAVYTIVCACYNAITVLSQITKSESGQWIIDE